MEDGPQPLFLKYHGSIDKQEAGIVRWNRIYDRMRRVRLGGKRKPSIL